LRSTRGLKYWGWWCRFGNSS